MIYLDCASTTRPDPSVVEAMARAGFGNPSSLHAAGREARRTIDDVRERLAAELGFGAKEITFTSGATEADNLAVLGLARGRHVVVSAVEHAAVLEPARRFCDVSIAPVDANGRVIVEALAAVVRADTALISVMTANNEVGTIQPIEEIVAVARGVPVHTDAAQAFGKVAVPRADLVTISGHKINGPKGVGALASRRQPQAQVWGGGHEFERRAGTENVAAIAGLGAALALPRVDTAARRDRLEAALLRLPGTRVNGGGARLPTIVNVSFDGIDGEALVIALDRAGVCAATGSACASGSSEPSHVLAAMGFDRRRIAGSVRLSLDRFTTDADVDGAVAAIRVAVGRLRSISPVWNE